MGNPIQRVNRLVRERGLVGLALAARQRIGYAALELARRPLVQSTADDPYYQAWQTFLDRAAELESYRVLELGSRARVQEHAFRGAIAHLGMDINPGPNVDIVGDAHELSTLTDEKFDVVYSVSVFEHLAMPWKAVLKINRVMNPGGLLYISTHPCWPAHALPWDFYRFQQEAFRGLLNPATGFEIELLAEGLPAAIVPLVNGPSTAGMAREPVRLGVAVLARKISEPSPDLKWDVSLADFLQTSYPESGHSTHRR